MKCPKVDDDCATNDDEWSLNRLAENATNLIQGTISNVQLKVFWWEIDHFQPVKDLDSEEFNEGSTL